MYLSTLCFIALSLTIVRSIPSDECAFGAFNDHEKAGFCYALGGGGKLYNISDPALDIDNIATICQNVKWAIANGVTCTYNDLIWHPNDTNAACPKCPCTDNGGTTSYLTFENFYDQRCVGCTCNTFPGGSEYGWDCYQFGDVALFTGSYTTAASWDNFECDSSTGPTGTCTTSADGVVHLNGDGYWNIETCDQFCYCDNGTPICRTGYEDILGTDDDLRAAFVKRCGEKVQGCLAEDTYGNIVSKANLTQCMNTFECPLCGCGDGKSLKDVWIMSETDYVLTDNTVCLSCVCVDDGDGNKIVNCNNDERYPTEDNQACPGNPDLTCYYGSSQDNQTNRATYAPNTAQCEKEYGVCGWDREYNQFDGYWTNKWGCTDSVMCDVANVTDGCIHASNSFDSSFGCGILDDTQFGYDIYKGCYSTNGSNANSGDIPSDPASTCSESAALQTLYDTLFMCLAGTDSGLRSVYDPDGSSISLNYDTFKCEMKEPVCQHFEQVTNFYDGAGWTYSVNDYIYWTYGCGCTSANAIYESADPETQAKLEEMAGDDGSFVRNLAAFAGQDGVEWAQNLGCNVDSVSCDVTTGDIVISPLECSPGALLTFSGVECLALCWDSSGGASMIRDAPEALTFEQIKGICPNVELGGCDSLDDLVWPDVDSGDCCPYCSCPESKADDLISTDSATYLFGQICTVCQCIDAENGNDEYGIDCTIYGDVDGFSGRSFTTTASAAAYDKQDCPPEIICTSNITDTKYSPGQSLWNGADEFCMCQDDGTIECESTYSDILTSSIDDLTNQFLKRCGEDLEGCLSSDYYDNIVSRAMIANITEADEGEYEDCPLCGCGVSGETYTTEERSSQSENEDMMVCRTCVCATGVDDDYPGLATDCDDSDPYLSTDDSINCPSSGTCFIGFTQEEDGSNREGSSAKCSSDDDTYCGLTYEYSLFGTKYEWQCQDRVQCEAFGVTGGSKCVRSTLNVTFGAACGGLKAAIGTDTIEQTLALMCCSGDDCNKNMNISDVETDCEENEDFANFNNNLFGCLIDGESTTFSCPDSDLEMNCDNFKDYLMWQKGCACTAANGLWSKTSGDLKDYLVDKVQSFLDNINGISGDNADDWNEYLQCEYEWKCDIETGEVMILGPTSQPTSDPTEVPGSVGISGVVGLKYIFAVMFCIAVVVIY